MKWIDCRITLVCFNHCAQWLQVSLSLSPSLFLSQLISKGLYSDGSSKKNNVAKASKIKTCPNIWTVHNNSNMNTTLTLSLSLYLSRAQALFSQLHPLCSSTLLPHCLQKAAVYLLHCWKASVPGKVGNSSLMCLMQQNNGSATSLCASADIFTLMPCPFLMWMGDAIIHNKTKG